MFQVLPGFLKIVPFMMDCGKVVIRQAQDRRLPASLDQLLVGRRGLVEFALHGSDPGEENLRGQQGKCIACPSR